MIRAIVAEMFKDFKPSSYAMIRNDYGIFDLTADEESELFGGIMDKGFDNLVPKDFQKDFKNLETNGNNSFLLELKEQQSVKDLFCAELNEIKKEIKNIKKEEKESCRQNLLNLFKCVVCFESAPNSYMSCPFCAATNVSEDWIGVQFAEENSNAIYVIVIFQKVRYFYQVLASIFLYLKSDVK